MDSLIKALKQIAEEFPLNTYEWDIAENCPIQIPANIIGGFSRNIFLKENFRNVILNDQSLNCHYWAIQAWGGIGSFKRNEKNDQRIIRFLTQLQHGKLTKNNFGCISSLSKVASFINPDEYAIYDSRAIYTLNWLLFNHAKSTKLFPQPTGRSSDLAKYDMQTIFRLTKRQFNYEIHNEAFHQYCKLIKQLACEVFGAGSKPYKAEMLLFMAAPKKIINEVEASVSLTIKIDA